LYESLRCLEFASRTKNIRNKPIIQRDPTQNLIFELKREIKKLREQNKQLQGAVMSSLAAINSSQPIPQQLQSSTLSRSSVSTGPASEKSHRQAALQLHLFDSSSEDGQEALAPLAKTTFRSPLGKVEKLQNADEPTNADLISRTQWFLQMHADKPQDTYEKLLFDELKTLVAEYSVTRKTSSLFPREGTSSSSKPAALMSTFGMKTQFKTEHPPSKQGQISNMSMFPSNNFHGGSGLHSDFTVQPSLQQRVNATTLQIPQSSFGNGHTPSLLKTSNENPLEYSPDEIMRKGSGSLGGRSPPSSHGMKFAKRFGQDPSRKDSSSCVPHVGSTAAIFQSGSSPKNGRSQLAEHNHIEGFDDDDYDGPDFTMAAHKHDQDSALLEIEQLKAELDRESAAFQGCMKIQQMHQFQQQHVIPHREKLQHNQPVSLPLISDNSHYLRDHVPDTEHPRRRQHQRASQSISLSSSSGWAASSHSPSLSRLQTSNFQSRSMEQRSPQRLVRSETGAAEKEGWKNRVSKAEAAIRYDITASCHLRQF
jgi:hypothetical protein